MPRGPTRYTARRRPWSEMLFHCFCVTPGALFTMRFNGPIFQGLEHAVYSGEFRDVVSPIVNKHFNSWKLPPQLSSFFNISSWLQQSGQSLQEICRLQCSYTARRRPWSEMLFHCFCVTPGALFTMRFNGPIFQGLEHAVYSGEFRDVVSPIVNKHFNSWKLPPQLSSFFNISSWLQQSGQSLQEICRLQWQDMKVQA